ncbi:hypothetical protein Ae505Ps2_4332 [Pseudonocardia sp. Ae505_Ps2]|nr:hypothetical protein Ae505Ps2_4332 [Pseudonocardia sp. Ae505_Ps2]
MMADPARVRSGGGRTTGCLAECRSAVGRHHGRLTEGTTTGSASLGSPVALRGTRSPRPSTRDGHDQLERPVSGGTERSGPCPAGRAAR